MLTQLKLFFFRIWYWRKHLKFNKINKNLTTAVVSKSKKRRVLAEQITTEMRSFLGFDKDDKSNFIPYDYKTRVRVQAHINEKYGYQMTSLNLKLNTKLQLS